MLNGWEEGVFCEYRLKLSFFFFFLESHIAMDKCTFYIGDVSDHG